MFFKKKSVIMFRNYENFGYITDNRNFEYKRVDDNRNDIGDKILSESGAVFLSILGEKAQDISVLVEKISSEYPEVDKQVILKDAEEFFCNLEKDGFIVSGGTLEECEKKDKRFSYKGILESKDRESLFNDHVTDENTTQDFFSKYFNNKPQLTSIHIEIISQCNERCLHCYIPHENKVTRIDPDLFNNIIEQCKDMKLLHLTLSGGEPMLHDSFCHFLKRCRETNFSVNVLSNLTLLNDQIIEEMRANPLLGVQVSLYSMDPRIHDKVTQIKGSFKKTKKAIMKLIENDIPLKISCPILKQNRDSYTDVIQWAKNRKIHVENDYVILARYNHTTKNLDHRLSINEVKDVIYDMARNDIEYINELKKEAEKKYYLSANDYICSVCSSSICISDNGIVHPCAGWQDFTLGNIRDTPLKEIWNNSPKVTFLRNLKRKDFPECLECPERNYCTMCMVRNANEDPQGNPLVVNKFFCEIAKINRSLVK